MQDEEIKTGETEESHAIKENKGKSKKSSGKEEKQIEELKKKLTEAEARLAESHDKFLRLSAEYDNYRKRSVKEKIDLLKTAAEESLIKIIPVMDDFERALVFVDSTRDPEAVKEGIRLIYNKFKEILAQQGIKEIEALKQDFNTDLHEAVTKIPAPEENLKGKVLDVVVKGYYLNDKVIRYAKVIVGE